MTPEDQVEAMRQARMKAAALRGEDPEAMVRQADTLQGIGGALAGLGGRPVQAMSEDLVGRGDTLRQLVGRNNRYEKTPEEIDAMAALAEDRRSKVRARLLPKASKPLPPGVGDDGLKESDVRGWSQGIPDGVGNIFGEVNKARAIADEVGGIDKLAGVGVLGGRASPILLPEKDQQFRQHAAAAANAYRKIFAGAAVSEQEGAQINRAIAQVESGKTAREVATGLMILESFANDSVDQALAGADPRIVDRIHKGIYPGGRAKKGGKTSNVKSGNTDLAAPPVAEEWTDEDEAKFQAADAKIKAKKAGK